jgi:hypothetical protein
MGMYDTVIVEGLKLKTSKEVAAFLKANSAKLPSEFQTKDLENFLATCYINEAGQIFETVYKPTGKKKEYVNPFKDWVDNRSFLEKLFFNVKYKTDNSSEKTLVDERIPVKSKSKITKTFEIYTYVEVAGRYLDLSYDIVVADGKVKSVKLRECSVESEEKADQRHKNDAEFKKNMEISFAARRAFQSKWYYPVLKETVNPVIFFAKLLVQKLCSKVVTWSYRWHGV